MSGWQRIARQANNTPDHTHDYQTDEQSSACKLAGVQTNDKCLLSVW